MTKLSDESFTRILVNDVIAATKRLEDENTPTHRRDLLRHFKAAQKILNAQFPGIRVAGIFLARRVPEAVDFSAFQ